jgi:hypothetical protein
MQESCTSLGVTNLRAEVLNPLHESLNIVSAQRRRSPRARSPFVVSTRCAVRRTRRWRDSGACIPTAWVTSSVVIKSFMHILGDSHKVQAAEQNEPYVDVFQGTRLVDEQFWTGEDQNSVRKE